MPHVSVCPNQQTGRSVPFGVRGIVAMSGTFGYELDPAQLTEAERAQLCEAAVRAHEALGLAVYSRSDFILDKEGRAWWLEVNTLPGMTPNSLIPKAAAVEGIDYAHLCEKIVELSLAVRR